MRVQITREMFWVADAAGAKPIIPDLNMYDVKATEAHRRCWCVYRFGFWERWTCICSLGY